MASQTILQGLAIAALVGVGASAAHATAEEIDLGGPLSVNSVEISPLEIKRALINGPGRAQIEYRRVHALIEDQHAREKAQYEQDLAEWEAREEAGEDPGPKPELKEWRYHVDDELFEKRYQEKLDDFAVKYPTLDVQTEMQRAYRNPEWYKEELRLEILFEQVFIPESQEDWPLVTFEAVRAQAGDVWIDDYRDSYERRFAHWEEQMAAWEAAKAAGEDPGPEPEMVREDEMYRSILRQMVREVLYSTIDTRTAMHGLPEDVVFTMDFDFDGEPEVSATVDEMWPTVKTGLTQLEVDEARRMLALLEATRQRLEREGYLLTPEQRQSLLDEQTTGFVGGLFQLTPTAIGTHHFPSVESYVDYMTLKQAYANKLEPELATPDVGGLAPVLRDFLPRSNRKMGLSKVDAEVLLVSAYDEEHLRWKEDGWKKAKEKAEWLLSLIDENFKEYSQYRKELMAAAAAGREPEVEKEVMEPHDFWSYLLDEHCEFWDPPPPSVGRPGGSAAYRQRGRFGEKSIADLQVVLGDPLYRQWLYGQSIAQTIFYDQQPGTVGGPYRGPAGYYLVKVLRRTPPKRTLNVNDERYFNLLKGDYINTTFVDYCQEALEQSDVIGL